MVDNCYGEFVEDKEPTDVGVDIMAGSLIKNPEAELFCQVGMLPGKRIWLITSYRMTVPGLERKLVLH